MLTTVMDYFTKLKPFTEENSDNAANFITIVDLLYKLQLSELNKMHFSK